MTRPGNDIRPIDHTNPLPYYHQLASILREELERGRWEVGQLLPAEGDLITMFGVSRSVTRKALDLLEGEGRVLRIKGKGTLVTRPKTAFGAAATAARWYRSQTEAPIVERVLGAGRVAAGGYLGRLLNVAPGDDVWEIRLLERGDEAAPSLVELYLKVRGTLTTTAPPEFAEGGPGIYQQLAARFGVEVTESQVEIEMAQASAAEASVLSIAEGDRVVQVSSLDHSRHGVVGFVRSLIPAGSFFLQLSLRRSDSGQGHIDVPVEGLSRRTD